jgi:hypothetical protein
MRAAECMVIARTDRIIRSMAKPILAQAVEAAADLQRARLLLRLIDSPERAGRVPFIGLQSGVFDDDGAAFEGERAWRRADATKAAEAIRNEGFTGEVRTAVKRHLDHALHAIFEGGGNGVWRRKSRNGPRPGTR